MENMEVRSDNKVKIMKCSGGNLPIVIPRPDNGSGEFNLFNPKDGDVFNIPVASIKVNGKGTRHAKNDGYQKGLTESIREVGHLLVRL